MKFHRIFRLRVNLSSYPSLLENFFDDDTRHITTRVMFRTAVTTNEDARRDSADSMERATPVVATKVDDGKCDAKVDLNHTWATRAAFANWVIETILTIACSQITYNYEYQIIWPVTCMVASFVLCAVAYAAPRFSAPARACHVFVIVAAIIGASTSRYALMSSDLYVCTRKTNNLYPTFTDVDMTTGQVSLIPGKPSCHRTKILYAFELLAFASRLICYALTMRTL